MLIEGQITENWGMADESTEEVALHLDTDGKPLPLIFEFEGIEYTIWNKEGGFSQYRSHCHRMIEIDHEYYESQ